MLNGAITALVTPMNTDGGIDFVALDNLIETQISNKINGLVVLGSTGESMSLSVVEKLEILKRVIHKNRSRVKVIAGISNANTSDAVAVTQQLNEVDGVDYVMALTPYYVKPTQDGLYHHFEKIANVSRYPVILYNVPGRTGCDLKDDTALRLANDFKNIVGLKDATGDIARACYLVKHCPQGFMLFSGDDATSMAFMLCGGDGVISVVSNLVPSQMSAMCEYAITGDKFSAIEVNNSILELHSEMFVEANPIPIKWALYNNGIISSPHLRLPLTTLSNINQDRVRVILEHFIPKVSKNA